jgi:Probable Zinc-ribbon domain
MSRKCDCKQRGIGKKVGSTGWICEHNNLLALCPRILNYWSKKNNEVPENIPGGSSKRYILECLHCKAEKNSIVQDIVNMKYFICRSCGAKDSMQNNEECNCKENGIGKRSGPNGWICEHNNLLKSCPNIRDYWSLQNAELPENITKYSNKSIILDCKICNYIKISTPYNLTRIGHYNCKGCLLTDKNVALNYPHLLIEVYDNTDLSKLLSGSKTIVSWKCGNTINNQICAHVWKTPIYSRTLMKHGCPKCADRAPITFKIFIQRSMIIHNNKYLYSTIDIDNFELSKKIDIWCPIHKIMFSQIASKHMHGNGCKLCGMGKSKGNLKIYETLKSLDITFEQEKGFDDLRYIKKLWCDFYLDDFKIIFNNRKLIFEYDGIQHFLQMSRDKGNDNKLKIRMIRDMVKDQYCIDNNIDLVRIPYNKINYIQEIIFFLMSNKNYHMKHFIYTYKHYILNLKWDSAKTNIFIVEIPHVFP